MHEIMEAALKPFAPAPLLKEGDIFTWRFKPEIETKRRQYTSDPYHCRSRIAIVKDGILQDTFWYSGSDNSTLHQEEVDLTFQGNPADMTVIPKYDRVFYRPEDIVDMNHPNNSGAPVYVKAGKGRDPETIKQYFEYVIERAESDKRSADWKIEKCREALEAVARGEIDLSFPVYNN